MYKELIDLICDHIPEQKQEFETFCKLLKSDNFKAEDYVCITGKELIKINEDFSLFEKVKIKHVYNLLIIQQK